MTATLLVVEDNPITRKMLRFTLESEGYDVLEASDGATALELAAGGLPDLVLLDNVLPDMDGIDLLGKLRALPGGTDLRVLMLTGMVSRLDDLRDRSGGSVTVLPKPIEPSRLIEVIRGQFTSDTAPVGRGRRVLVVDDEALNLKLAMLRLRDAGFSVETALGAEEGLVKAGRSPPDALLSDVLMPGMDGFLLCRSVREDPSLAKVPVVLLSASYVDEQDQRLARGMGASRLVLRTPDFREAIEALVEVLDNAGPTAETTRPQDLDGLYRERLQAQLETQLARNNALLRQAAVQAAGLSVVRGLSDALAQPRLMPEILGDVLVHCLDAAGLSTGLLYFIGPDGTWQLEAQTGVSAAARERSRSVFGHPELVEEAFESGRPFGFTLGSLTAETPAVRELLAGLESSSALIIPFLVLGKRYGALLLASSSQDMSESGWTGFALALAAQFGQTIALGQALSRLAESEQRLRCLAEGDIIGVSVADVDGRLLEANDHFLRMVGYAREDLAAGRMRWGDMTPPEWREKDERAVRDLIQSGRAEPWEKELFRKDGSRVPILLGVAMLEGRECIAFVQDISVRRRAQEAVLESAAQYRLLFDSNPHPMWVFDEVTLAFLAVNDAAIRQYGYSREEFLAMTALQVRSPEDVPAFCEAHRERVQSRAAGSLPGTWRHLKKDGTAIEVEGAASPIVFQGRRAWLSLIDDVTEKKSLEAQLVQAQKMESVGRLAGGVAHDFNNLLGVITGYGELLRRRVEGDERLRKYADDILKAAGRAAGLTRQLLAFSRKQVLQARVLDLNVVVGDMEKMLRRLIGEDVQLVAVLDEGLGSVRADPGQIEQVLMNLVVNARDAMPRGGRITIETGNIDLDTAYCRVHPEVEPGRYAMFAVSDTGHGMDADTQSRVFEPFFTTKEEGKGTGLGLATVHGIVKQSGGHILVYSEVGRGTAFKVCLPRVDEAAATPVAPVAPAELARGSETVLLAEDEGALRELVAESLRALGYFVLEARHAGEALEIGEQHPIDLLVTDVVMPGMSGRDLAERLRVVQPHLGVLYMSGYTDDAVVLHGVLSEEMTFLQKPFTAEGLARRVRQVLDGRAPPSA